MYSIGQYRYRGTGCATKITGTSVAYVNTQNDSDAADDSDTATFKDICINTPTLSENTDYYLKLKVPQDLNYAYTFQVRLTRQNANTAEERESYQYLRGMSVAKPAVSGTAKNVYTVALYDTEINGRIAAMVPIDYKPNHGISTTNGLLYRDSSQGIYYLGKGGTSAVRTDKYNDISMVANWISAPSDYYGILEIVFRPVAAGFNQILLQMNRTAEDYNIQRRVDPNDLSKIEYGRVIDKNKFSYSLYSLNDLVRRLSSADKPSLARIGVWGRPGLFMAVNGEEIRIGASGFYEMDVLPITSFGIYAPDGDYTNNFTIDYTIEDK